MDLCAIKIVQSSSQTHRVAYTIGIKKCDGSIFESFSKVSEFKENERSSTLGHGHSKFMSVSKLLASKNILSLDDSLTVYCFAQDYSVCPMDVTSIRETASQTISLESVEILQENLNNLFQSGCDSNVTLKVKDQEFKAHRLILISRSSVFYAMFNHDTKEKKTGIVSIIDCDPESFKDVLSFLYTGKLDMVSPSNAAELYKIADKYDLKCLKKECFRCLGEEMSVESFFDAILLAAMYQDCKLMDISTDFFIKNVKVILRSPRWQSLISENFKLANELLIKKMDESDFQNSL